MKKLKITTTKQFEMLIAELESKPSIAKGFYRGSTPQTFKQDWENITLKLNSIGPPLRDSDGWQKVWRDYKCKVKKKLIQNKIQGNAKKQLKFSTLEIAAANLMQFQKLLNTEGLVQGIQSEISDVEIVTENSSDLDCTILEDDYDEDLPSSSTNAILIEEESPTFSTRKRKKPRINDEHKELLSFFNEISSTMIEIKNVLKETSQYQKKLCEIEEKKLIMMERQHQREEQLFEAEIQLKNIKTEI